jgi:hypothetical protein
VSLAGLVPVTALTQRAGLAALVREHVTVGDPCGAATDLKVGCLVAGMAAGADSIEDMDVLRQGGSESGARFTYVRAGQPLRSRRRLSR